MVINAASRLIVKADQVIDYIPFISLLNNAAITIAKIALAIFSVCFPSIYNAIKENALIDHIVNQKSVLQCIGVAIPILNIFVALCRDFPEGMTKVLQDKKPSPTDRIIDDLNQKIKESSDRTIQEAQRIREEAKQRRAADRAEDERKHREKLADYDRQIAACSNDTKGQELRKKLIIMKQFAETSFASARAFSDDLYRANGY